MLLAPGAQARLVSPRRPAAYAGHAHDSFSAEPANHVGGQSGEFDICLFLRLADIRRRHPEQGFGILQRLLDDSGVASDDADRRVSAE